MNEVIEVSLRTKRRFSPYNGVGEEGVNVSRDSLKWGCKRP